MAMKILICTFAMNMKRIVTKIGDIFCVEIGDGYKCFFQYIANDMTMLNSSVIRVFSKHYPIEYVPVFDEIVKDEVSFYAHTILRFGIVYNAWYKVGKHKDIGNTNEISFRLFDENNFSQIEKSYTWSIWKINQKSQFIGELNEKYKKYDLGFVFSYDNIVSKIATGKFLLKHIE